MRRIGGRPVYDRLEALFGPVATAGLVVDIQNGFCPPDGHRAWRSTNVSNVRGKVPSMGTFVPGCQAPGVRPVFLRQCTLPNGGSDFPMWMGFKTCNGRAPEYTPPSTWGWEFVEGLTVRPPTLGRREEPSR